MARVTVTNTQGSRYLVPSPIRAFVGPGRSRVFDNISISAMETSDPFVAAVSSGIITVVVEQDPGVPDAIEGGSQEVSSASLLDGSVTTPKLAPLAVTTAKIDALAVTAAELGALAVETAKIDALAVTTAKIDALAVTTAKIAALAVTSAELAATAVTTAKMAIFLSGNITADGTAQSTAHSLGVVPVTVLVIPTGGDDGAGAAGIQFPTTTEGAHTSTNVIVTGDNGSTYRVLALA